MYRKKGCYIKSFTLLGLLMVCVAVICACGDNARNVQTHSDASGITAGMDVNKTEAAIGTDSLSTDGNEVSTSAPSDNDVTGTAESTAISQSTTVATPVPTENVFYDEIAMTFFNGTWESSSGTVYVFSEKERSIVLKDKYTGEVLLEGSYNASTSDFTQYDLSMTFHGETDEFIAWLYSDTGSVALLTKGTMKNYDNMWRAK